MALDGTSTLTDAVTQYRDNLGYRAADSVTKAQAFVEACLFILEARPGRQQLETLGMQRDLTIIERRLEATQAWLDTHPDNASAGAGTTYMDLSGVRR